MTTNHDARTPRGHSDATKPASHTPGPWAVHKRESIYGPFHYITGPSGERLNERGGSPEGEANARLIAAAPELLEACQLAIKVLQDSGRRFPKSIRHPETFAMNVARAALTKAVHKAARAAIAKAEGGAA